VLSRARGGLGSTSVARVTFWRRRRAAGRPSAPPAAIFQPPLLCTESATILVRSFPGFERTWRRWGAVRNARSYLSKPRARASKEGCRSGAPCRRGKWGNVRAPACSLDNVLELAHDDGRQVVLQGPRI
jgi:hypothetical protein